MAAKILNVCVSTRKGTPKRAVERGFLRRDHGLVGDAHAGAWHRQVSLLDAGDIDEMEAKGLTLEPGAFGENFVISGLDTGNLGIGSRLRIDEAEVEIAQIGKACHSRCAIFYRTGDCIMPRRGLFAFVTRNGAVRTGSRVEVVHSVPRSTIQAALVVPAAREDAGDVGAEILQGRLGAHIAWCGRAPESLEERIALLRQLCGRRLDLVVALIEGSSGRPTMETAMKAVMDEQRRSTGTRLRVCGAGSGVMLVAVATEGAAETLGSSVFFLRRSIAELRRERSADNGRISVSGPFFTANSQPESHH